MAALHITLLAAVVGQVASVFNPITRYTKADQRLSTASHRFSPYTAEVSWTPPGAHSQHSLSSLQSSFLETSVLHEEKPVRILHVTDNHISVDDMDPPHTTRMFSAFFQTSDHRSNQSTSPQEEFTRLLRKAKKENVDLIALGGDLINYPSPKAVSWVLEQLHTEVPDIPFVYTAGNHDWHEEGIPSDTRYDSARIPQLDSTLRPLFEHSATRGSLLERSATRPGAGRLYGKTSVRGLVDVYFVDNSNHQLNAEQVAYFEDQLQRDSHKPAVLLMHMPLKLPGTPPLEPKYLCGHPAWGADVDDGYKIEQRPQWPKEGNSPSTAAFIELVQKHSSPAGRITALLTGHVHKDFTAQLQDGSLPNAANLTSLSCGKEQPGCQISLMQGGSAEALGAVQYTTLDAAEGGSRLLDVRIAFPPHI